MVSDWLSIFADGQHLEPLIMLVASDRRLFAGLIASGIIFFSSVNLFSNQYGV